MNDSWIITGGEVLTPEGLRGGDIAFSNGVIGDASPDARIFDAGGLLILPGIVDIHGDGFERQIMPRPGVSFPHEVALPETDRQLVANGITTAFHGLTISWEPGLRSLEGARGFIEAWRAVRSGLRADTRLHLRWETFALDAADTVCGWFGLDPKPIVAFNDHTTGTVRMGRTPGKLDQWAARAGLSVEDYSALLDGVWARRDEVPCAIDRMAARARERGLVLLAHDETSPAERERFRALGAKTSEFPMTRETAAAARAAGEHAVLGAPNVLRGGSHTGALDAAEAVAEGLCTVLTSDYFYPAPLIAAFRLAEAVGLERAWPLVARNAAEAAGLVDRGELRPGLRADVIAVETVPDAAPRVAAVFVAGRQVHLAP
ncbi:alpha-D-ribose 1-methylphosphonate 5-triphosphate diphosphatase [Minwuia thermotolerans]|uniref:Alpha-D-ribose 1-methylphosphonate 5-triphosphate diphosphatase n=1 Tax=Minwuia thermotolerans TaxID=2056226 RepID=A0A2M9G5F6_9PROT|nr:alpha-D-ribose 1-methylphosphonate 5-triphosphate diphosphatase [Minwuia thermotolerans]PJK30948.1 alpha-D-ribose 1-methylphosphonate 5-triphosphate diphosphatase [Minwuia thermotolerans]